MNPNGQLSASVVITTKNRCSDLQRALLSCMKQTATPEILVVDDGSTDGTSEMVRIQFPQVTLHRSEVSLGLIAQRNAAASLAKGDIIFSIDDDAEFSTPRIVEDVLKQFSDRRIAAIAIPFINVRFDSIVRQSAPDRESIWITNEFIGTAHALRRSIFLDIGRYTEFLHHQGEEGDLCIRLLNGGFVVALGSSDPIHHYESPHRDRAKIEFYGQRNLILFAWYNVPTLFLPIHAFTTIVNGLVYGFRARSIFIRLKGVFAAALAVITERRARQPVSLRTYLLYRSLKKRGPQRLS